mgnify:FL=1|jgi:hypothetical protein
MTEWEEKAASLEKIELDLPTLNGTEKQIKWAESIRNEALRICDLINDFQISEIESDDNEGKSKQKYFNIKFKMKITRMLNTVNSAAFFIDNRDYFTDFGKKVEKIDSSNCNWIKSRMLETFQKSKKLFKA